MKKIIVLALAIILVFAFCACGNGGPGASAGDELVGQTVAGAPDMGNLDVESSDEDSSDVGTSDEGTSNDEGTTTDQGTSGDSSSGTGAAIIPNGDYYCYDRFSGEGIPGYYIRVHSSDSSQVVFDYVTSAGTFTSLTANIDANGFAYLDLTDTLGINITFYSSEIYVDELEGMGAMAYVFR